MPRSNWKGNISFGLVNIPILLYSSEETSQKISFHQIDKRNNARIKYKRINVETGREVPWNEIIKGYEYDKDTIFPVDDNELKKIAGENSRTIAIESFINKDNIDFIDIDKTYYLIPDKKSDKGYVILREALIGTNKIGIAKVIISTKEYLAAVAPYKEALVLYLLRYPEEIRSLSEFKLPSNNLKEHKISTKEVEIAKKLIQNMSSKWQPQQYKDDYKLAVKKWIDKKIHHLPPSKMKARSHAPEKGKIINFVDLLRKSLKESEQKPARSTTKHKKIMSKIPKKAVRHLTSH